MQMDTVKWKVSAISWKSRTRMADEYRLFTAQYVHMHTLDEI